MRPLGVLLGIALFCLGCEPRSEAPAPPDRPPQAASAQNLPPADAEKPAETATEAPVAEEVPEAESKSVADWVAQLEGDRSPKVRTEAIEALEEEDEAVRREAARALKRVQPLTHPRTGADP